MSDFHLLLEEQIPQLMRYASALTRDPEQASDLVEDTVIEALVHRRGCTGDIRLQLLTILHDLRGNPFRQMTTASTAAAPIAVLTLSQLDRALGQLPEEQRAAILLLGLEGMTYEQIAAILRIPVSAVRSRLSRGREGLRRFIGVADSSRRARAA